MGRYRHMAVPQVGKRQKRKARQRVEAIPYRGAASATFVEGEGSLSFLAQFGCYLVVITKEPSQLSGGGLALYCLHRSIINVVG